MLCEAYPRTRQVERAAEWLLTGGHTQATPETKTFPVALGAETDDERLARELQEEEDRALARAREDEERSLEMARRLNQEMEQEDFAR